MRALIRVVRQIAMSPQALLERYQQRPGGVGQGAHDMCFKLLAVVCFSVVVFCKTSRAFAHFVYAYRLFRV